MLDVLRGIGTQKHEIELRIPLQLDAFDITRTWFDAGHNAESSMCTIKYCNDHPVRCIDGAWQSKHAVDKTRVHVIGKLYANLVVSLEVDAPEPDEHDMQRLPWMTRTRTRWVYPMGNWTVEWTKTEEYCNVELEWNGDNPTNLARDPELDNLSDCLRRLMPCIGYLNYYNEHLTIDSTGVYVKPCFVLGMKSKEGIERCSLSQQPVSLQRVHFGAIKNYMASVKYDGLRVVACFVDVDGFTICVFLGKFGKRTRCMYAPCRGYMQPCVLDGELMSNGQFIAFDIIEKNGVLLTHMDFRERIETLRNMEMPAVMGHAVIVKQFWPSAEIHEVLAHMKKETSDGIVFHCPSGRLMNSNTMYKWKPNHTVDLKIGADWRLRTRKMSVQSLAPEYQSGCNPGEIWEFSFQRDRIQLRPVRIRNDKTMPNGEITYRDVRTAHRENITTAQLISLLT